MVTAKRITMTKAQAESADGQRLIEALIELCKDGCVTRDEIIALKALLAGLRSSIPAIPYLLALVRECLADEALNEFELYQLKKAFERVVPKGVRAKITDHLREIGLPSPRDKDDEEPAWHRDTATPAQLSYIVNLGGDPSSVTSKGDAAALIDALLERRPPTPRQQMLIRFFDQPHLAAMTKEEVSVWLNGWFSEDPRREMAWDLFKRETGHDAWSVDASQVPIGAYRRYMRKRSGSRLWVVLLGAGLCAAVALGYWLGRAQ